MTEENIAALLHHLGVDNGELFGDWYRASCPLAFARHKRGKDESPSFGVFHNPTGRSGFNCFGCNIKGHTLDALLTELHYYAARKELPPGISFNLSEAYKIVEAENEIGYAGSEWEKPEVKLKDFEAFPQWWLDSFPTVAKFEPAMAYLKSRGVPAKLWQHFHLRYDSSRKMLGFPFFNRDGKLAGMRGRDIRPGSNFPHYDYKWNQINNTQLILLGEHEIDYLKPLVIIEGQFDYANVYANAYRNVVSNLTASLSEPKLKKLELAVELIGMWDDDEAGAIANAICEQRFKNYHRMDWTPMGKYRQTEEDKDKFRDPGECNRLQLRELLGPYVKLDAPIE